MVHQLGHRVAHLYGWAGYVLYFVYANCGGYGLGFFFFFFLIAIFIIDQLRSNILMHRTHWNLDKY